MLFHAFCCLPFPIPPLADLTSIFRPSHIALGDISRSPGDSSSHFSSKSGALERAKRALKQSHWHKASWGPLQWEFQKDSLAREALLAQGLSATNLQKVKQQLQELLPPGSNMAAACAKHFVLQTRLFTEALEASTPQLCEEKLREMLTQTPPPVK